MKRFVELLSKMDKCEAAYNRAKLNPKPGRTGKSEHDEMLDAKAQIDTEVRLAMEVVAGAPGFIDESTRKLALFNTWAVLRGGWT